MTALRTKSALAATVVLASLAATSPSLAIEPMRYMNALKDPGENRQIADLWKSEVSDKPSWGLAYATFKRGATTVTVLIGQENACDNGPNHVDSQQNWSSCPLHVITTKDGQTTKQTFQGACYNDNFDAKPTASNYVGTEYDQASGYITVKTFSDGQELTACTKRLQVN